MRLWLCDMIAANDFDKVYFEDIQLLIDDYTWFERASYDGYGEYILKAHPLLSSFKNQESHSDNFLRRYHGN